MLAPTRRDDDLNLSHVNMLAPTRRVAGLDILLEPHTPQARGVAGLRILCFAYPGDDGEGRRSQQQLAGR